MCERIAVSIVDDDESVRESLSALVKVGGFRVQAFASAREFVEFGVAGETKYLILDAAMPGMTGPDLHRELRRRGQEVPIVYFTARRDESVRPAHVGSWCSRMPVEAVQRVGAARCRGCRASLTWLT